VSPATVVDRQLERRAVVAVGVEAERYAIVLRKVGVVRARRAVWRIVDIGRFMAANGDV